MNEATLFVPKKSCVFEEHLLDLFGGFTGPIKIGRGSWRDAAGKRHDDNNVGYTVAYDKQEKLALAAGLAKKVYRQLAVYVRYTGKADIL